LGFGYTHILTPNKTGCHNATPPEDEAGTGMVAVSTTSEHPGFVNTLVGDGRVRPSNDAVDLQVWLALGTRDGGESLPVP
jgi:hypothetical protein